MAGNGYVFDDKLSELLTISNEEDNSILLFVRIKNRTLYEKWVDLLFNALHIIGWL